MISHQNWQSRLPAHPGKPKKSRGRAKAHKVLESEEEEDEMEEFIEEEPSDEEVCMRR